MLFLCVLLISNKKKRKIGSNWDGFFEKLPGRSVMFFSSALTPGGNLCKKDAERLYGRLLLLVSYPTTRQVAPQSGVCTFHPVAPPARPDDITLHYETRTL